MTWVDYTIIAIIVFSVIIGLLRGFVREVVSLVVWVGGIMLILNHLPNVEYYLSTWIDSLYLRYAVTIVGVCIILMLISWVVGRIMHLLITSIGLGFTNRFFGLLFGFLRGVAVVGFLSVLLLVVGIESSPAFEDSVLLPSVQPLSHWLATMVPEDLSVTIQSHVSENTMKEVI